jgi:hypothetical protein
MNGNKMNKNKWFSEKFLSTKLHGVKIDWPAVVVIIIVLILIMPSLLHLHWQNSSHVNSFYQTLNLWSHIQLNFRIAVTSYPIYLARKPLGCITWLTFCVDDSWIEEDLTRRELVTKSPDSFQQYVPTNISFSALQSAPCRTEKVAGAVTI